MVKKLFALASVSALAGLVSMVGAAGCSDEVVEVVATEDAGADVKKAPKADSGPTPVEDDDAGDEPVEKTCLTEKEIDPSTLPTAPALIVKGACTTDESKAITDFLQAKIDAKDFGFKQSEWAASVSEKCASCVFTEESAEKWGVIIGTAKDEFATYNRGGCIEVQSGNAACGEAYQAFQYCSTYACGLECKTQEEYDACSDDQDAIYGGPCKATLDAVTPTCGKDIGTWETACSKGGLTTFISAQCIVGSSKTPDAGDGG